MEPLYTQEEFDTVPSGSKTLKLKCRSCLNPFLVSRHQILRIKNKDGSGHKLDFCSIQCAGKEKTIRGSKDIECKTCAKTFKKKNSGIKKSVNHFCSRSCSTTYNNTHKKHGTRRSKLESYLEEQIRINYPDLELLCNNKSAIESELDFYFPSIQLAIELNGIFHYEPIYGEDKLSKIRENDERKFFKCQKANIALAIIDSSTCQHLTDKTKDKYWTITKSIVDRHLATISSVSKTTA